MSFSRWLGVLGIGILLSCPSGRAESQEKEKPPADAPPKISGPQKPKDGGVKPVPEKPKDKPPRPAEPAVPPDASPATPPSAFTPGTDTATASAPASANPQMLGDFFGYSFVIFQLEPQPNGKKGPSFSLPDIGRGSFKVAENESPRPVDRVYLTYNYFHDVNGSVNTPGQPRIDVHRETLGFEKTFWQEDASIGLRLPLLQSRGLDQEGTSVGDLTIVTKVALLNDRASGDIFSGGLLITVPTGEDLFDFPGEPDDSTLLQPWLGFIWNLTPDLYFHGFTSGVFPTEKEDISLLSNDLGVGYVLYRNPDATRSIVPTFEAHWTHPLDDDQILFLGDGFGTAIVVHDVVDLTLGTHFVFGGSTLTVGVATPVTGPKLFAVEGQVQLNVRF